MRSLTLGRHRPDGTAAPATAAPATRKPRSRRRRFITGAALLLAASGAVVAALLAWIATTESGTRFALARLQGLSGGKLAIGSARGALVGPLALSDVRYRDDLQGVDARFGLVELGVSPWELAGLRLHVTHAAIRDVSMVLTTVAPVGPRKDPAPLEPPLDVVLDGLRVERAAVVQDGQSVLALDLMELAGSWTGEGVMLERLAMRGPGGHAELRGTLATTEGFRGRGLLELAWRWGDLPVAGLLDARSDGERTAIDLTLSSPAVVRATGSVAQADGHRWQLDVEAPLFDPRRITPGTSLTACALDLRGSGDAEHVKAKGKLLLGAHQLVIEEARLAMTGDSVRVEEMRVASLDLEGSVTTEGEVHLQALPLAAALAARWEDVRIPATLAGQELHTNGALDAELSIGCARARGELAIGPPGRLADLGIDVESGPSGLALHELVLRQARGGLVARGSVATGAETSWEITATADRLDPGAFVAGFPGSLDFELRSEGRLAEDGPHARVVLEELRGTLRDRPVAGHADLELGPGGVVEGTARLRSAESRLDVVGRGGPETDARLEIDVASLADLLPEAEGTARGMLRIAGRWPALRVSGRVEGRGLAYAGSGAATLAIDADVRNAAQGDAATLLAPQGALGVAARDATVAGVPFGRADGRLEGRLERHALRIDATGSTLSGALEMSGRATREGRWSGSLERLELAARDLPELSLRAPARLEWDGAALEASDVCLAGGDAIVCASGRGATDGTMAARARIERLPLALGAELAMPDAPVIVHGTLTGSGEVRRDPGGALGGRAHVGSVEGRLAPRDAPEESLVSYRDLAVDALLGSEGKRVTIGVELDHGGRVDGELEVASIPAGAPALSGRLQAELPSLAMVELLTGEVDGVQGRLAARADVGGTTASPDVRGSAEVTGFAARVPGAGLALSGGELRASLSDGQRFDLHGSVLSGGGRLEIAGAGALAVGAPSRVTFRGSDVLAADVPGARVVISPDLVVERGPGEIAVSGSVAVRKSEIDLAKLPGGGVARTSPDVVVLDAGEPASGTLPPIRARVTVEMQEDVKLAGHGLDGRVAGRLVVEQEPERTPRGTGTLDVTGTYQAYGQDLVIEHGRLLFVGGALDNPGVDLRAVRTVLGSSRGYLDDGVVAGLLVRGTALAPTLEVFSEPAMPQSQALSYLVLGKPLDELQTGEGDALDSAAQALGSGAGNLLAKRLGTRVGAELSVAESAALGGTAFTVGKYLAPKLFLSYGIGVFDPGQVVTLRYLVSPHVAFEAENATTGSRAGVTFRHER